MAAFDPESTDLFLSALRRWKTPTAYITQLPDYTPGEMIISETAPWSKTLIDEWARRTLDGMQTRACTYVGAEIRFTHTNERKLRITFEEPDRAFAAMHRMRQQLAVNHGLKWKPRYFGGVDFAREHAFVVDASHTVEQTVAEIVRLAGEQQTTFYSLILLKGYNHADSTPTAPRFTISVAL